ncbi:hypothetical protein [Actinacidiphila acidipaludis]|uniref:hypothetical protein n=1 Tax=Actinacidiphila acidipaludis TaxID=2873382 RepID=UPI0027E1E6F6|nr:hypothetical protein [Streptomyces acidipaludis]
MSITFSSGWPWACYAFLVGCFRRSKVESIVLSALGLTVGVAAYYLAKKASPSVPGGGWEHGAAGTGQALVWVAAAFVLGAPVGFLGNVARTPGIGGLPFRLLVPLIACFEATERLGTEARAQGTAFSVTWNVTRVAAVVCAAVLVGHTVWSWWTRRSRGEEGVDAGMPGK